MIWVTVWYKYHGKFTAGKRPLARLKIKPVINFYFSRVRPIFSLFFNFFSKADSVWIKSFVSVLIFTGYGSGSEPREEDKKRRQILPLKTGPGSEHQVEKSGSDKNLDSAWSKSKAFYLANVSNKKNMLIKLSVYIRLSLTVIAPGYLAIQISGTHL